MLIPVGYAQINVGMTVNTWPYQPEVVFGVRLDNPGDTPFDVADKVWDEIETHLVPGFVNSLRLVSVRAKFGPNETGPFAERTGSVAGPGPLASASPQVSLLVHKTTLAGGRRSRGRSYWPVLDDEAILPNGNVLPARVTGWQTRMNAFLAGLLDADVPMVLLHHDPPSDVQPYLVQNYNVDSRSATQRRRNRR